MGNGFSFPKCYFQLPAILLLRMRTNILLIASLSFLLFSCEEEYVPKPKGFNRIDLPAPKYLDLEATHPYSFQYSSLAVIQKDVSSISEPHWISVHYPYFDADIQLTYKPLAGIKDRKKLDELIDDSYKLANKHQVKAYSIEETQVRTPSGKKATIIELAGEVPSPFQFYMTDSTHHFVRGALYFRSTQIDSLSPAIEYLKKDVMQMVNTMEWR